MQVFRWNTTPNSKRKPLLFIIPRLPGSSILWLGHTLNRAPVLKGEHFIFGILFTAGLIIMCVTSRCFDNIQGMVAPGYSTRDCIVLAGQDIGELLWVSGAWMILRNYGIFMAVVEFAIAILVIDLIMVLFFNPYLPSWPKDTGVIVSFCFVLVNTKRYLK